MPWRNLRGHSGVVWAAVLAVVGAWACAAGAAAVERPQELLATAELEGRQVLLPPDLPLDLLWYSPVVGLEAGRISVGWVKDELILLATDRNYLVCVQRDNGTERWRCVLEDRPRYEPVVSRNNVVANVNNVLVGIDKRTGEIRWRLTPNFVMSNAPVVVDPPAYPKAYSKEWSKLENIYVGSWKGRMHCLYVRGRIATFYKGKDSESSLTAPDFDLMYPWHKTHSTLGIASHSARLLDGTLYYAADDKNVYALTREGEAREPYTLLGLPCTPITLTAATVYIGARDFSLYALDRYTLKKKWAYPSGAAPQGRVFSDESQIFPDSPEAKTLVCLPTERDGVHALRVLGARGGGARETMIIPESFEATWKVPQAQGVVGASPAWVYLGYELAKEFGGYAQVAAVDKTSGKVAWQSASAGVRFYLEYHNAWRNSEQAFRLYAVTEDNRLLALKEKATEAGPVKPQVAPPPAAPKKVPGEAQARVENKTEGKTEAKAEEKP